MLSCRPRPLLAWRQSFDGTEKMSMQSDFEHVLAQAAQAYSLCYRSHCTIYTYKTLYRVIYKTFSLYGNLLDFSKLYDSVMIGEIQVHQVSQLNFIHNNIIYQF